MGFRPVDPGSNPGQGTTSTLPTTLCGSSQVWSKMQGLGPCRVGVPGFKNRFETIEMVEIPSSRTIFQHHLLF